MINSAIEHDTVFYWNTPAGWRFKMPKSEADSRIFATLEEAKHTAQQLKTIGGMLTIIDDKLCALRADGSLTAADQQELFELVSQIARCSISDSLD